MKRIVILALAFSAITVSCNPAEAICSKEFECQAELELSLDDDYVAVCAAGLEGENNRLRKSAEPTCEAFANQAVALAGCESVLGCEDLKKSRADPEGADDLCSEPRKAFSAALADTNNLAECDGIEDVAAEGEGEGEEGEGEGEGE